MSVIGRRSLTIVLAATLLGGLAGWAGGTSVAQETPTPSQPGDSLLSNPDAQRRFAAALAAPPEPQSAAIYGGSCDALDDQPAFPLSDVTVQSPAGDPAAQVATSYSSVSAPIEEIVGAPHAVIVATGGDPAAAVACGEIGATVAGNDLFFGLREVNDSGYTGIGWLHADGDSTRVTLFVARDLAATGAVPPGPPPPPSPPPVETETPEPGPSPTRTPVSGTTYTSELFGYSITYDDPWEVSSGPDVREEGDLSADYIQLFNGVSTVDFLGVNVGINARQCLEQSISFIEENPAVEQIEPRVDDNGDPIAGGSAADAFAAWEVSFTNQIGELVTHTLYYRCIVLRPGQSFLVTSQETDSELYEEQAAERETLYEGLTLP
jgi:hypothetical protein